MGYLFLSVLFSLAQIVSAWGYGRVILRLLRVDPGRGDSPDLTHGLSAPRDPLFAASNDETGASRIRTEVRDLFALGLGLAAMGFLVAALGLVHAFNRFALAAVLMGGWIAAIAAGRSGAALRGAFRAPRAALRVAALVPFFLFCGAVFFESLVPDYSGDGYLYHLSAPLFYCLEGGFVRQDWAVYYHYPLLAETLYVPALALGLEQAAILLNFWIALASAAVLYVLGASLAGRFAGWAAAFVYLGAPCVVYWTPTSQPETAGTLFLLLALLAMRLWRTERRAAWAVSAGILAGAMTGAKILYALFAIVFFAAVAIAALRDAAKGRASNRSIFSFLGAPCGFAVGAAAAYAPWLVKNALYAGNPFFPVALGLFPTVETLRAGARALHGLHGFPAWEGVAECARRALQGYRQLMGEGNAGFAAGMLWAPVAFVAAWARRRERLFWSVLLAIWLVVAHYGGILQVRWFLPAYAALALAAGAAAAALENSRLSLAVRRAILFLLGVVLAANWALGYRDRMGDPPGFHRPWTTLGARGREEFVSRLPRYAPARLANAHVEPKGRVLVIQNPPWPQVRWYERRFVQNGQDWFGQLAREGLTDTQIAAVLRAEGVTHVAMQHAGRGERRLTGFVASHAVLVASDPDYAVYVLNRPPDNVTTRFSPSRADGEMMRSEGQ